MIHIAPGCHADIVLFSYFVTIQTPRKFRLVIIPNLTQRLQKFEHDTTVMLP